MKGRRYASYLMAVAFLILGTQSVYAQPGTLKWRFRIVRSYICSSPAIGSDGTIYVGSYNDYLYAINPDGTLKWRFKTEWAIFHYSSPAIGSDGTIYIGSTDTYLYAINPDGTLKWRFETGSDIYSSPAIGKDGTIYVGSGNYLYAINSDGTLKWEFKTGGETWDWISVSPAIGKDGIIYIGSTDGHLYAINPDGTLKWGFKIRISSYSSLAIDSDGTIYAVNIGVGFDKGYLYAINPDGTLKWKFETGWGINHSPPAIGRDGTIYVGSTDDYLYAINPDGTLKWKFEAGGDIDRSPAIGSDGTIYIGSTDGYLYAINPDGTLKWMVDTEWAIGYSSPAISDDGTIYVGSGSCLCAINSDSRGPADSPWPMFHHDVRHTGRVGGGSGGGGSEVVSGESGSGGTEVISDESGGGGTEVSVDTVQSLDELFATETVYYNPLLPPDDLYLYYIGHYTTSGDPFEKGDVLVSTEEVPLNLTGPDGSSLATRCEVYESHTQDPSDLSATLKCQVPFSQEGGNYTLYLGDKEASVQVATQVKEIYVLDRFTPYGGVTGSIGAQARGSVTLLGSEVALGASAAVGAELGFSAGFENEVFYSGGTRITMWPLDIPSPSTQPWRPRQRPRQGLNLPRTWLRWMPKPVPMHPPLPI